jgi:hypothetical protein
MGWHLAWSEGLKVPCIVAGADFNERFYNMKYEEKDTDSWHRWLFRASEHTEQQHSRFFWLVGAVFSASIKPSDWPEKLSS